MTYPHNLISLACLTLVPSFAFASEESFGPDRRETSASFGRGFLDVASIPEPATLGLLGIGAVALFFLFRRPE